MQPLRKDGRLLRFSDHTTSCQVLTPKPKGRSWAHPAFRLPRRNDAARLLNPASYKPSLAINKPLFHGEHIAKFSGSDVIVNEVFKGDMSKARVRQERQNVCLSSAVLILGNAGHGLYLERVGYLRLARVVRLADH